MTKFDWRNAAERDAIAADRKSRLTAWITAAIGVALFVGYPLVSSAEHAVEASAFAAIFVTAQVVVGLVLLFIGCAIWLGGAGPIGIGIVRLFAVFSMMNVMALLVSLVLPSMWVVGGVMYLTSVVMLTVLFDDEFETGDIHILAFVYTLMTYALTIVLAVTLTS